MSSSLGLVHKTASHTAHNARSLDTRHHKGAGPMTPSLSPRPSPPRLLRHTRCPGDGGRDAGLGDNGAAPPGAEMAESEKKEVNYLAQDRMWKDHIRNETEAAKKWTNNWGFLTTPYEELIKNEKKKEIVKINLPEHMQVRPVTPIEKYIKVRSSQRNE